MLTSVPEDVWLDVALQLCSCCSEAMMLLHLCKGSLSLLQR